VGLMRGSAAQCALQCNEIPWRWSFRGIRGVRIRVWDPRHCGRAPLEVRACGAARGSDTRGARVSDVCATGSAVQEGGRAARKARSGQHAATEEDRAVCVPCCRAARDSLARHDHRGCGYTLGVPPHSTAQAAACSL